MREDLQHKQDIAIARIKEASRLAMYYFKKPLVVCVSGGKDSTVLKDIAISSGEKVIFWHNYTGIDAPETVHFIESEFDNLRSLGYECVKRVNSKPFMVRLEEVGGFLPTRWRRWCCQQYKEVPIRIDGEPVFIALGVRWAESPKRASLRGEYEVLTKKNENKIILRDDPDIERRLFEECKIRGERIVNPIIDWSDEDIWDYIHERELSYNPLYDMGFKRVGCIGCPMATIGDRIKQFEKYPKFLDAYISSVMRGCAKNHKDGKTVYFNSNSEIRDFILTGYSDHEKATTIINNFYNNKKQSSLEET